MSICEQVSANDSRQKIGALELLVIVSGLVTLDGWFRCWLYTVEASQVAGRLTSQPTSRLTSQPKDIVTESD